MKININFTTIHISFLKKDVKMKKIILIYAILFMSSLFLVGGAISQETKGNLIFRSLPYQSEEKIPKDIKSQLDYKGIIWGFKDSTLVVTKTSPTYINAEFPYTTRYGEEKSIELKTGKYNITCIGFENNSVAKDVNEQLSKNSFYNVNVLSFNVTPDKTTIIEILPMMIKDTKSNFSTKYKMFIPEFITKIIEDGKITAEKTIDTRTENSISWDDYTGPLKIKINK